jgi:hypothetical protein
MLSKYLQVNFTFQNDILCLPLSTQKIIHLEVCIMFLIIYLSLHVDGLRNWYWTEGRLLSSQSSSEWFYFFFILQAKI